MQHDFDALWDYDRPVETERRFRECLERVGDRRGPAYTAELLTQIARAQGLQRRFADAHATLDQVEATLRSQDMQVARVRYLLERGRVLNSSGNAGEARPLFAQAWEQARAIHRDDYAVDAAHMIAIADPAAALEWNQRALELAESSPQPGARRWRGSLANNIGWTLHAQARYAEALTRFEQALRVREEAGTRKDIQVARWCVARCLRSLGRVHEALAMQRELLAGSPDAEADGYTHEELGECLLALGRAAEARPHFQRAYALLRQDPWLVDREPARIARLGKLAAE